MSVLVPGSAAMTANQNLFAGGISGVAELKQQGTNDFPAYILRKKGNDLYSKCIISDNLPRL